MKNKLYIFICTSILLISISNCSSKKQLKFDSIISILIDNIPKVNSETEILDTSVFQDKPAIKTITDHGIVIECFRKNEHWKMYEHPYWINHRMIVDYQFIRGKDSKILGIDYSKNPMFGIFKQFTSDGIIQLKGLKSYYGFKLGIWYYYDASGKLIKCIDQDAGYKFGTLDVINYCLKNKIPVNKQAAENMPDWPLVTIAKIRIRNGHPAWFIIYPDGTLDKRIYIDAKNGKVVETQETPGSLN